MLNNIQSLVGLAFVLGLVVVDGFILVEERGDSENMVWIEGGTFTMGSDRGLPDEAPARPVEISGFWIDKHEVTNGQFKEFVETTGYTTAAEQYGDSMVFKSPIARSLSELVPLSWWELVAEADWRHPEGPQDTIHARMDHPVVQVNYEDALSYCKLAGQDLAHRGSVRVCSPRRARG